MNTAQKTILKIIFNKDFNIINGLLELQALDFIGEPLIDTILEEAREKRNIYNIYYHHNYNFLEELLLALINDKHLDLIELINYDLINLFLYDLNIFYNAYKTFDYVDDLISYVGKNNIEDLKKDDLLFILDDIIILVNDTAPNKIYHC